MDVYKSEVNIVLEIEKRNKNNNKSVNGECSGDWGNGLQAPGDGVCKKTLMGFLPVVDFIGK